MSFVRPLYDHITQPDEEKLRINRRREAEPEGRTKGRKQRKRDLINARKLCLSKMAISLQDVGEKIFFGQFCVQ